MTRGTLILLLPQTALMSVEFNGDMYGSPKDNKEEQVAGHYPEAIRMLTRTENADQFKEELKDFDREYFNYQKATPDISLVEEVDWRKDWINSDANAIDFDEKYFEKFFSDYLFFKNLSQEAVRFRSIDRGVETEAHTIYPGEIATFHFGRYIETISVR